MFDNIDKRRNFQIDVQKLGTEEWYVWLDPEERMQYSEAVKNANAAIMPNAISVIESELVILFLCC